MTGKCPICGKTSANRYRPFCSKRCADLDLGSWLDGNYRLPTDEEVSVEEFADELAKDDQFLGNVK